MAEMNLSTMAGIYKRIYPQGIEPMVVKSSPFLGLVEKKTGIFKGLEGSGKELAWRISNGTGASGSYAVAYAQPGNSDVKRPYITRGRLFATRKIGVEAMAAAEGNAGALVNLVTEATKSAAEEIRHRSGSILLTGPAGAIGQISATSVVGTATITLADTTQKINFKPGQRLQAFTTVAGGLLSAGAVVTLAAAGVNYQTGQLTATGNWSAGIAAIAAGDYLVPEGDFGVVPVSMDDWNPDTLPTVGGGDSFFGIDRGGSVPMAGYRYAPSSGSVDEVIMAASAEHQAIGGYHNMCLINSIDFMTLNLNAGGLTRITKNAVASNGKEIASIGYNGVVLNGSCGPIEVFPDPYMRRRKFRLFSREDVKIWSLGEPFGLRTEGMGGQGSLRIAGEDAIYMVFGGYWNTVVEAPINCCNGTLPA